MDFDIRFSTFVLRNKQWPRKCLIGSTPFAIIPKFSIDERYINSFFNSNFRVNHDPDFVPKDIFRCVKHLRVCNT